MNISIIILMILLNCFPLDCQVDQKEKEFIKNMIKCNHENSMEETIYYIEIEVVSDSLHIRNLIGEYSSEMKPEIINHFNCLEKSLIGKEKYKEYIYIVAKVDFHISTYASFEKKIVDFKNKYKKNEIEVLEIYTNSRKQIGF